MIVAHQREHAAVLRGAGKIGVAEHVAGAVDAGATVLCGGTRPDGPGWFYPPTVITDITEDMELYSAEVFGPVASLYRIAGIDEAIELANATEYGLAAGVWTRDLARAQRVVRGVTAGTVWINMYRAMNFAMPFGGTKVSGSGRVNGMDGFAEFTQTKAIWSNSDPAPVGDPFVLR